MIEISTPSSNSISRTETTLDESQDELSENESAFYEMIKPTLNQIVIEPSEKVVQNILAFSKSI